MQGSQTHKPIKLNLDKSRKALSPDEAFFLLNQSRYAGSSKSLGKTTPLYANDLLCDIAQPLGENYSCGTYKSEVTGEEYSWIFNTNGVHYIYRVSPEGCDIVAQDDCIEINPHPRHSIEQSRAYLDVDRTCKNRGGKLLIWVDGSDSPIGCIDTEASIATDSFRTKFFEKCVNRCELFQLCVPKPCDCITAEYLPLKDGDEGLDNKIQDGGFQFIFRHVYYDGKRASEWSDPSTYYYQDTKECFVSGAGLSRCMALRIPIGNPMVDRIEIAYSKDGGTTWFLTDVVEKYNAYTTPAEQWYERELSDM